MRNVIWILAIVTACRSSTPGARPHDMSAARHEQAARKEEHAAEAHTQAYDPSARRPSSHCSFAGSTRPRGPICWTSIENPTQEHVRAAEKHRNRAAEHRAASRALRDAEAHACVGIAEEDRDTSPFERSDDITSVDPLLEYVAPADADPSRQQTVGAVVTFRARPGLTVEWLQRVVDCHLARNAALGHVVSDMPDCPLVPKGVTARVKSATGGFATEIRAKDDATVREVLDRARRSQRPHSEVTTRTPR